MIEGTDYNFFFNSLQYIITIQNKINNTVIISIEDIQNTFYWKTVLNDQTTNDLTYKIGSVFTLDEFINLLISALLQNNPDLSLSFLSLNEIQNQTQQNSSDRFNSSDADIKKYLMLNDSKRGLLFPIQFEYLNQAPDSIYLLYTINRLKQKTIASKELLEIQELKNKIKILDSHRKLGAVDYDDIQNKYYMLKEEREKNDMIIKKLKSTIEDLHEELKERTINAISDESSKNIIKKLEETINTMKVNQKKDTLKSKDDLAKKDTLINDLNQEIKNLRKIEKDNEQKIRQLNLASKQRNLGVFKNNSPASSMNSFKQNLESRSNSPNRQNNNSFQSNHSSSSMRSLNHKKSNCKPLFNKQLYKKKYSLQKPGSRQSSPNSNMYNYKYQSQYHKSQIRINSLSKKAPSLDRQHSRQFMPLASSPSRQKPFFQKSGGYNVPSYPTKLKMSNSNTISNLFPVLLTAMPNKDINICDPSFKHVIQSKLKMIQNISKQNR